MGSLCVLTVEIFKLLSQMLMQILKLKRHRERTINLCSSEHLKVVQSNFRQENLERLAYLLTFTAIEGIGKKEYKHKILPLFNLVLITLTKIRRKRICGLQT